MADFLIKLSLKEWKELITIWDKLPENAKYSEQGVAMISSVIKSDNDFVKVPGGGNCRMLFPQLDGPLRITFQGDSPAVLRQVEQGEHLPGHFKDQGGVIKGEAFSNTWFGQAVFPDFFDVHRVENIR